MDYLKDVQNVGLQLWRYIVENKWVVIFIVFGVIVAYSLGQQVSRNSGKSSEHFENRCEKERRLYEDNKPCEACEEDKPKKKSKKIVASASCPKMPDMSQYVLKKNVPDLKDYVHKTLLPDMSDYMLKDYVKENYIRRTDCKEVRDDDSCDDEDEIMVVDAPVCPPKTEPQPACNKDLNYQAGSDNGNKKISKEAMKKYQDYLDKNAENMDVSYSKIEDAFTSCNFKLCPINGLPNGLKPVSKS